jgi:hypothetical protein
MQQQNKSTVITQFWVTIAMYCQALIHMSVSSVVNHEQASSLLFQCIMPILLSTDNILIWI